MKSKSKTFESFPKQQEFIDAISSEKYNFILYGGAIRGGKTYAGLGALILLCFFFPNSRWAVVRRDLPTLKRNTIPSWNKIKPSNFIKSENWSDYTVTMKNGSQIIFFSESYDIDKDLDRWKGLEVNGFLFEEIQECQYQSFMKAFERAGSNFCTPYPNPIIMATCNPSQSWVKKEVYDKWRNGTLPEKWLYIPSKIYDNPFVEKSYLESIQNMGFYQREVFINGNWDFNIKQGGEFWKSFELDKHVASVNYIHGKSVHVVFDDNIAPYVSIQLWQVDEQGKQLRQFAEIPCTAPDNTAVRSSQRLTKYLNSLNYNDVVILYGDSSTNARSTNDEHGRSFYTLFESELNKSYRTSNRVGKSNPSVSLSGQFVNEIYERSLYNWSIKIDEGCKESIADYIETKENKDGGIVKQRITVNGQSFEKNGHFSDCKRYFITSILKTEYQNFIGKSKLSGGSVDGW